MKLVFITNIYNHHTGPLGDAFYQLIGDNFCQICTEEVDNERLRLGWSSNNSVKKSYLRFSYHSPEDEKKLMKLANDAEIVIYGGMDRRWIANRIQAGKLTFRYSERLFKKGFWRILHPKYLLDIYLNHLSLNRPNFHLLCAGAYVAFDMARLGAYRNRMWKWGYFTDVCGSMGKTRIGAENERQKKSETMELLWCGRMIRWKQVIHLLKAAVKLKQTGLSFHINLVGEGVEEPKLRLFAEKHNLNKTVSFHPPAAPKKIRALMGSTHIYVLPSNFQEGWGAVVNEAMSSGCCVVSSSGVGSAGFLINSGENGFVYKNGSINQLTRILSLLLRNPETAAEAGNMARKTIQNWSPDNAARRFLNLANTLSEGKPAEKLYKEGLCSQANTVRRIPYKEYNVLNKRWR
jgi:glycosyltransferase involved in cell wall biosynthesis